MVLLLGTLVASLGIMGCPHDLEGKKWLLTSYGDPDSPQAVIEDTRVTAEFSEGEVAGTAGCNNYFGSYEIKGESLTFGAVASTEMWCEDPEGVMDQETEYLRSLGAAERYQVKDGKLQIFYTGGQVLTFAEE